MMVSADTSKAAGAIRQWELAVTLVSTSAQVGFGMYSGTAGAVNMNASPSPEPGRTAQPNGFFYGSGNGGQFADYNAVGLTALNAWVVAAGDVYTVIWDSGAHTIDVWATRSGASTHLYHATGITDANMCPFVGADQNGINGTVNFGGSAFTYALSNTPGAVAYQS